MKLLIEDSLYLESVSLDDANCTYDLINGQREYLKEWLPWVDYNKSVEDVISNIKRCMEKNDKGISLDLSIKKNGKVIGRIGLHYIDNLNNNTSIGYWLSRDEIGKGIMTKAVQTLCRYCFTELNMNRIGIACATNNIKSQAIPTKLGFKLEGKFRERELVNGMYLDHYVYSKLKREL